MTENVRLRKRDIDNNKRILIVVASVLFFPIALPVYLVIWIWNATNRSST